MLCSKCHTEERIPGQRWCRECLTAYQRNRRATLKAGRITAEQGDRDALKTASVIQLVVAQSVIREGVAPKPVTQLAPTDRTKCVPVPRMRDALCPECNWSFATQRRPGGRNPEPHIVPRGVIQLCEYKATCLRVGFRVSADGASDAQEYIDVESDRQF
jgi:hypothetical protein